MDAISDRISLIVSKLCDNKNTQLAKLTNTSEANIRNYISGRQPKYDFLSKLVSELNIDAHWLLSGEGSMLKQTEDRPIEKTGREEDLMQIIKTQAQTLLEQQRFIQENCGRGILKSPPLADAQFADNKNDTSINTK